MWDSARGISSNEQKGRVSAHKQGTNRHLISPCKPHAHKHASHCMASSNASGHHNLGPLVSSPGQTEFVSLCLCLCSCLCARAPARASAYGSMSHIGWWFCTKDLLRLHNTLNPAHSPCSPWHYPPDARERGPQWPPINLQAIDARRPQGPGTLIPSAGCRSSPLTVIDRAHLQTTDEVDSASHGQSQDMGLR